MTTLQDLREGVLPDTALEVLLAEDVIQGSSTKYIQPGSIDVVPDLNQIYELSYFGFPRKNQTIDSLITQLRNDRAIVPQKSQTLLPGKRYLIKLREKIRNNPFFARMNPKSSPGRLFIHSRLVCDRQPSFDEIEVNYSGDIWMIVMPKFLPVTLGENEPISQLRFFYGNARLSRKDLARELGINKAIVRPYCGKDLFDEEHIQLVGNAMGGVMLCVDLDAEIVCFKTKKSEVPIDLLRRDVNWKEYFTPVYKDDLKNGGMILETKYGYLFGSRESTAIPAHLSAEVVPISDRNGEFRSHYAGFVDSTFGTDSLFGNTITLEVAVYEAGIYIRHGQPMAELQFEYMAENLGKPYQGNYITQERGPKLPKYFAQSRKMFMKP